MIMRLYLLVLVALTAWVAVTAIRIERLNAEAEFYLPRQDSYDGKWRVFHRHTVRIPRDELRGLVQGIGLLQYLLAPLLIGMSVIPLVMRTSATHRFWAMSSLIVGVVALGLAFYRGYFTSLG